MKKIVLAIFMGFFITVTFAADVYKYTDSQGNIFYSDKKPTNKINESKLKKITIIESDHINPKSNWQSTDTINLKPLSEFENFVIASPENGSTITIKENNLYVITNLAKDLAPQYRIKFYLNGVARGRVKSSKQLLSDMDQGTHTLFAEIINANNRKVIKTTPEITFNLTIKNQL